MSVLCESIMSRNIHTCLQSDPAMRAAVLMRENGIGLVPITDTGNHVKGVVTDRDLTLRVLAQDRAASTPLEAIMSKGELVTVQPGDTLQTAEERMMKAGVGRALVTDPHGKLLGVISRSEIARVESLERTGKVLGSLTRKGRAATR